jgi:glycosyltransferase involved in cell wall biosynthesis
VVAITEHVAADIRREMAPRQVPLQVVHNGVTDLTQAARQAIDELAGAPFLLHVSRMAPSKNIVALIDLAAAWPGQRFVFAGADSTYVTEVRRLIAARGLHNVHIQLDLSDAQKAWLYAQCDGFLFPSLAEGFGLPPLEAMYFGKAVFLSRLTSLPEVGGDAAYYFDDFDGAAMRRTVEVGLTRHAAEQRAAVARAQAQRFSWARCADGYLAQYLSLLPNRADADVHATA